MSLNEIDNEGNVITGGGYNYTGPYFKYNGRKTVVSREIEPITYGLHNHGIINSFNLYYLTLMLSIPIIAPISAISVLEASE